MRDIGSKRTGKQYASIPESRITGRSIWVLQFSRENCQEVEDKLNRYIWAKIVEEPWSVFFRLQIKLLSKDLGFLEVSCCRCEMLSKSQSTVFSTSRCKVSSDINPPLMMSHSTDFHDYL